jgi:hypothetical protein
MLAEDQAHGTPRRRIATQSAAVVFGDARFKAVTRRSNVIAAVRAPQNVEIGTTHGPSSSFETRQVALLRMRTEMKPSQHSTPILRSRATIAITRVFDALRRGISKDEAPQR